MFNFAPSDKLFSVKNVLQNICNFHRANQMPTAMVSL